MDKEKLLKQIDHRRQPEHRFIKWWRREHDFLNYDLIDTFLGDIDQHAIDMLEDFELLAEEQMWRELAQRAPGHVHRERRTHGEVIVWKHDQEEEVLPYTPETMLSILDAETESNIVD